MERNTSAPAAMRRLTAAVMSGALLLGPVYGGQGKESSVDGRQIAGVAQDGGTPVVALDGDDCLPVPQEALAVARDIVGEIEARQESPLSGGDAAEAREQIAASHGLTVYGVSESHFGKYLLDYSRNKAVGHSFAEYLQAGNQFASQYGMTIEVASPDEPALVEDGARVPTAEELETPNAKSAIVNTVLTLSTMPVEFVRQIGWERTVLEAKHPDAAAYVHGKYPGTVFSNVSAMDDSGIQRVYYHEAYHLLDKAECGEGKQIRQDPGFDLLNKSDVRPQQPLRMNSKESIERRHGDDAYAEVFDNGAEQSYPKCAVNLIKFAELANAARITDYSYKTLAEDKAEIGQNMLDPYAYDAILDPRTPIIREKTIYLLGRMVAFNPAVAQYYGDMVYPLVPVQRTAC